MKKLNAIKQQTTILNPKQVACIKGGTNQSNTSTAIITEDVDMN